ncbi:uncharacterized protein K444DRAFT_231659 [Hyaloscypha bicolor E]|uniref:Uncharacterized protein n=1 Tax=Hyaloscypha bicolor E TaxID=1095630 RepID=A0A2J6SKW9_9HELO|nr:uncharacterized protein K444DRAFT_231659 [Hyaloscypha bicolor E]PMD51421.1 hypothetical protein K444DRAFT_231659 [Hyaloscypha bicolor E]
MHVPSHPGVGIKFAKPLRSGSRTSFLNQQQTRSKRSDDTSINSLCLVVMLLLGERTHRFRDTAEVNPDRYAVLSHKWAHDEITLQDLMLPSII